MSTEKKEHTKFCKRLIKIYKHSVNRREGKHANYHILVCFVLELYAGFSAGTYNVHRVPYACICMMLFACELIIEKFAGLPRQIRLMLERKYG